MKLDGNKEAKIDCRVIIGLGYKELQSFLLLNSFNNRPNHKLFEPFGEMMLFMLLFSRQGKLRLQKWYVAHPDKLKKKITRELITTILAR